MKVVLIKDCKGKGKKGDIIDVSDGYAQNFLIPNGYAKIGNASNLNEANQAKKANAYHDEQNRLAAVELGKKVEATSVTLQVRCGQNGKVFGSITNKEIAEALEKQGISVDKKKIDAETIKATGEYTVKVNLHPTVKVKLKVTITNQD
ncbi:MAG: 50S ribosomal protein L9 [Clostridia bacterium]|nr:50S ribosomal protein L9 [Clostridia bacterium]